MTNEGRFKFNLTQAALAAITVILIAIGIYSISINQAITGADRRDSNVGVNADVYETYYYYNQDRKLRYESYGVRKPNMNPSDVVWRVNADLDTPFYTKTITISDFTPPVLVNKYRRLPDDFEPKELVNTSSGQMMTPETKAAYEALRDAASEQGYHINAVSAYRSIEYQKGFYNKKVMEFGKDKTDRMIPRAAFSEQHLGTAVELSANGAAAESFNTTPEAAWIAENAYLFGFIVRYTEDNQDVTGYDPAPGLVTYVGVDISEAMFRLGIKSLEEYYVKHIEYQP